MFTVGRPYSKNDIYKVLNVPDDKKKGAWDTGYRKWQKDLYIFSNIGTSGRVGADYNNYWNGDELIWYAKPNGHLVKDFLNPQGDIFLFTRSHNKSPFIFQGKVVAKSVHYQKPVQITWIFKSQEANVHESYPGEYSSPLTEGTFKTITVNKYERNPEARQLCIEHYGAKCQVCDFTFEIYSNIGKGYIHVHHLILVSSIGKEYEVDPIKDLRPICANCHAMLHMRNPPYTIDELKVIFHKPYNGN